jgi:dipeptidyl-peptidase-4
VAAGPPPALVRSAFRLGMVCAGALAVSPVTAHPALDPLPAAVYERAERLLPPNVEGLVLNDAVVPHWTGNADEFWYERELRDGREFVLVDAATGHRRPAFDHARVAAALTSATGKALGPRTLPFREFAYTDGGARLRVTLDGVEHSIPLDGGDVSSRAAPQPEVGLSVSPDGRHAVATRAGNLWLRDLTTGAERALTQDGEPDAGYGIWPDGYFTNYVPRMKEGTARAPVGLRWSPDSRRLFVPRFDQRHVLPYPMIDSAPADGSLRPKSFQPRIALVGERPATVEWFVIDVQTGAQRRVDLPVERLLAMQADILPITAIFWRADGAHLHAVAHGSNMESAYLFDIDVITGKVRTVIDDRVLPRTDLNTTSYNLPTVWVSPDGRDAIWFSQRDGWGHLYLYDVRGGKLRNRITRGHWLVREIIRVDHQARVVYFTACGREPGNPYHRYLYRVNFDGSGLRLLTPEPADHMIMPPERLYYAPDGIALHDAISPSGRHVVYNYSAVGQPPKSVIRSTREGRQVAMLEEADASALFAAGWRVPEEFTTTAADGRTKIHGVMYKPSDFDPVEKYPVLDAQYASPLISVAPRNFYQSLAQEPGLDQASYAELGFIVVTVDGRGTTNRSREFSQSQYGRLNTNGLEDHVAAIRELAAQRPYMDLDRVGVFGVSYGGYMTLRAMLEFPDFYKAGVCTAGIAAMPGMFADYHWSAFQGRPRYADGSELRPDVASVPANWTGLDARPQVERLKGKLSIQLSELDENALPGQMMTFIDALMKAGKPFEMLQVPGRDHFLLSDPYVLQRNWDFMVRHLQGREPPADFRLRTGGR